MRKCLVHCLRGLVLLVSLLKNNGKAIDFSVNDKVNEYLQFITSEECAQWNWQSFEDWFHVIYQPLNKEVKQLTGVYKNKMKTIALRNQHEGEHVAEQREREENRSLLTVQYIRLSLELQESSHG